MRERFERQLEQLNRELITMGAMCENAIALAAKALIERDTKLADNVISVENEIDNKEKEIEALCMKLLLQQQPVARDLRLISAALKMITDMERIGDQSLDIAEIVTMTDLDALGNTENIRLISIATIKMVTDSIDAFVKRDLELARRVIDYDDVVDDLFVKIKNGLIGSLSFNAQNGENALDVLMIAKYFERIGDHATNIAEWVEFSITGKHVKTEAFNNKVNQK